MTRMARCLFVAFVLALMTVVVSAQREKELPFAVRLLTPQEARKPRPEGPLQVLGLDDRPELKDEIERLAFEARATIRNTTRIDWDGTAYIVWAENDRDYERMTRKRPEFTAAAANAAKRTVWINASAWKKSEPEERKAVLAHEFGHLLLGNLPGGRNLPLWAEEGIVQHLADEWSAQKAMALVRGRAFGSLPTLADLEQSFPEDPDRQTTAYALGYRAVEVVAEEYGGRQGGVSFLVRMLADPQAGPALNDDLWDGERRDAWNAAAVSGLGGRGMAAFVVITSGSTIWIAAMVLAFAAWVIAKRRRAQAARREAEEEAWARSLEQGDIQDIYGDAEDRFGEIAETPWDKYQREKEAGERP